MQEAWKSPMLDQSSVYFRVHAALFYQLFGRSFPFRTPQGQCDRQLRDMSEIEPRRFEPQPASGSLQTRTRCTQVGNRSRSGQVAHSRSPAVTTQVELQILLRIHNSAYCCDFAIQLPMRTSPTIMMMPMSPSPLRPGDWHAGPGSDQQLPLSSSFSCLAWTAGPIKKRGF